MGSGVDPRLTAHALPLRVLAVSQTRRVRCSIGGRLETPPPARSQGGVRDTRGAVAWTMGARSRNLSAWTVNCSGTCGR
jgi:hypothetical protein